MILTNILTGLSPFLRESDTSQKDSESDSRHTKTTKGVTTSSKELKYKRSITKEKHKMRSGGMKDPPNGQIYWNPKKNTIERKHGIRHQSEIRDHQKDPEIIKMNKQNKKSRERINVIVN